MVRHYVCTVKENSIFMYDTQNNDEKRTFTAVDVDCMCACGDSLVYFAYPDKAVMLDPATGHVLNTWRHSEGDDSADVDLCMSNSKYVAGVTSSTFVYVCYLGSSDTRTLNHDHSVTDASFHPKKEELIVAVNKHLCVWCTNTWTRLRSVHTGIFFMSLAHSPCGNYLAIGGTGRRIRVWRSNFTPFVEFQVPILTTSLSFSPCSRFLMSGDNDLKCTEWDWRSSRLVMEHKVPNQENNGVRMFIGEMVETCQYVGCGALISSDNASLLPLTFYGHFTNSTHKYAVRLLDRQRWWPPDISRVILSYLVSRRPF